MTELWKSVVGYEGLYEVSNIGRVRSIDRIDSRGNRLSGKMIRPHKCKETDHQLVNLSKSGKVKTDRPHRLVLAAFVGPCPDGYECCHYDGNPKNNNLENLRWDTRKSNRADAIRHGTMTINEKNGNAILTNEKAREIKSLLAIASNKDLAIRYGVARQTINSIRRGDSWVRV